MPSRSALALAPSRGNRSKACSLCSLEQVENGSRAESFAKELEWSVELLRRHHPRNRSGPVRPFCLPDSHSSESTDESGRDISLVSACANNPPGYSNLTKKARWARFSVAVTTRLTTRQFDKRFGESRLPEGQACLPSVTRSFLAR